MKSMGKKEKRAGIRIPLLSEKLHYFVDSEMREASVGDITAEGMFLKTEQVLAPKTDLRVQIKLPGDLGDLSLKAKVVRVNWAVSRRKNRDQLGFGVQFEDLNDGTKKILDAYVVYLRNKQIISVSKKIIEEFFGSSQPKKLL